MNAIQAWGETIVNPMRDAWDVGMIGTRKGLHYLGDQTEVPTYKGAKWYEYPELAAKTVFNTPTHIALRALEGSTRSIQGVGHIPMAMVGNINNNPYETLTTLAASAPLAAAGIVNNIGAYGAEKWQILKEVGPLAVGLSVAGNVGGASVKLGSKYMNEGKAWDENVAGAGQLALELYALNCIS